MVVIKTGGRPGRFGMTTGTVCWKLIGDVVGAGSCIVICLMAACAGIGRIVVVAMVAGCTVAGDDRVRSVQHIIIAVYRERGWLPTRHRAVTHGAVG